MGVSERSFALVLTTVASEEQGREIARALVERHLAACVNVVPLAVSIYRWRGEICEDREHLLLVKTAPERFPEVAEAIRELHSYELPDVLCVEARFANEALVQWLEDALKAGAN